MEMVRLRRQGISIPTASLFEDTTGRIQGVCEVGDFQDGPTRRILTTARFRTSPTTMGYPPEFVLYDIKLLWLSPLAGTMMLTGYERIQKGKYEAEYPQSWMIFLNLSSLLPSSTLANGDLSRWEMVLMRKDGFRLSKARLYDRDSYRYQGHCEVTEFADPITKRTMQVARMGAAPFDRTKTDGIMLYDARLAWFDPESFRFMLTGFERCSAEMQHAERSQSWLVFLDRAPPLPEEPRSRGMHVRHLDNPPEPAEA